MKFMKEYNEDEFLMLSGIQHFSFCRRQWALIHIGQVWAENYLTADGMFMHEKTHDASSFEKRGNLLISRGMPVCSRRLGVSGICDVVEFYEDKEGIGIYSRTGKYRVVPVEYKRGRKKTKDCDILQVVAQAMCLEEMLCCDIKQAYLYYGEAKHREEVVISDEYRCQVENVVEEMHELFSRGYIPKVKATKSCEACSLKEECLPKLLGRQQASAYIDSILEEIL